jgi:ubiquitin carboxyl-terminal hydrolase 14
VFAKPDPENPEAIEQDEDWYKFDDDKVSVFPAEKLATLDGGGKLACVYVASVETKVTYCYFLGQDASAYVLLYRSKPLA